MDHFSSQSIDDRRAHLGVEPDYWSALGEIGRRERFPPQALYAFIRQRDPQISLGSAVRVFVVRYFRELASSGAPGTAPAGDDETDRAGALTHNRDPAEELESFQWSRVAVDDQSYVLRDDIDLERVGNADPGIAFLFAYWKALTKGADQPTYDDFRLDTLKSIGFDANIHLIDVRDDEPDDFWVIRMAPVTMIQRTFDDAPLRSLGDTLYAREIKADYSAVKRDRRPVLQQLSVRTADGGLRYERIILPCAGTDGRITQLVVGVAPSGKLARPRPPKQ